MKKIWFLGATFISTVGDMLLVFSLPTGIGRETGHISSAVIFWLIPAIAVITSSFLGKFIKKRSGNERLDYSKLLIVIALLELGICYLTFQFRQPSVVMFLSCIFVFLYAFTKEGITRLFYNVAVYRFFCRPEEYSSLAGKKGGIDVFGGICGIALASYFVSHNSWRYALVLDAATFFVIASVITLVGTNPKTEEPIAMKLNDSISNPTDVKPTIGISIEDVGLIKYVLVGIASLHAVNALYANYQPLINEKLNIISAGSSIMLIALLRSPGAVSGLFVGKVTRIIPRALIIKFYPIVHLVLSLLFILVPHFVTMCLVIISGGIGIGIYIPTSISLLNRFSISSIVDINVLISRWLGIFQSIACVIAIYLFAEGKVPLHQLGVSMILLSLLSLLIIPFHRKFFESLEKGHV